ncbi:hypothetical protein GCM10009841_24480 [Microlunatus panaciterrae]|uniref:Aspartyl/glutamyl-tRNA(Asn/Gln) amidotransferase subunit C n=1 Tax=Microlunatus panaciterrae TaxID=400768 RepID=A0ABS2RHB6_9ACTN|nr:aspartyl-tRNA(Asn)/glutamyl-tRNA(Gln) amidotransferase subunit C [Microlunatus panaciterrae]
MALSPEDVADLARLARIELTQAELAHLAPQLDVILESVAHVADVAADDIPPTSHALPLTNVFRPDEVQASLPVEVALAGAPAHDQDRFRVPRILGDGELSVDDSVYGDPAADEPLQGNLSGADLSAAGAEEAAR